MINTVVNKKMNSLSQLFKLTFYSVIIQLIIWILSINSSTANVVNNINTYPCKNVDKNNICICEKKCLTHYVYENKTYCKLDSCWKYKDDECLPNGKNYITPLIFSVIPFTSVFGVGYGILERWDLFGMQLAITLGPIVLFCCGGCFAVCCCNKNDSLNEIDDDSTVYTKIFGSIYKCCFSILLLVFWVLSIVWVATPENIKDGNGCYLSGY